MIGQGSYSYNDSEVFVQYRKDENELYSADEVRYLIDDYENEEFLQIILDNASDDELIEDAYSYKLGHKEASLFHLSCPNHYTLRGT